MGTSWTDPLNVMALRAVLVPVRCHGPIGLGRYLDVLALTAVPVPECSAPKGWAVTWMPWP